MGKQLASQVAIDASADRVWQVLREFSAYPSWNPFIVPAAHAAHAAGGREGGDPEAGGAGGRGGSSAAVARQGRRGAPDPRRCP